MIGIIDINRYIDIYECKPVTDISIYDKDGGYTPGGLFSEDIFGSLMSNDRKNKYGYIDLGCFILNPWVLSRLQKWNTKSHQ